MAVCEHTRDVELTSDQRRLVDSIIENVRKARSPFESIAASNPANASADGIALSVIAQHEMGCER